MKNKWPELHCLNKHNRRIYIQYYVTLNRQAKLYEMAAEKIENG